MNTTIKKGYKQTELGVIPKDWDIKELRSLVDDNRNIRYGIVQPGKFDHHGRYMVRGQDYSFGWVDEQFLFKVSPKIEERYKNARLKSGDIILTIVGAGTGHLEIVPNWLNGANITQTTARIAIEKTKSDELYCKYFFQSPIGQKEIKNYIKGNAQPGLNIRDIKIFKLALPPSKNEQTAIATVLSDTDALIGKLEKLIAKKKAIKKGAMQQLLTGKKRLPGFSGEWEMKKLEEIGEIITGSTPSTQIKEYWNGPIPWITPTDISNKKNIYSSEREISYLGLQSIRKLPANTLLVTCIASIGKNAILRVKGACNQQINAIIPSEDGDVDFLYYLVENNKQYLLGNAGITATLIISKKYFSEIVFAFPKDKQEQTAIATILSDMDSEIEKLEQERDKYIMLKQGMMQQLLTGRIRIYANN
ncbi:MAG: restriction endonuclease subunit S [Candidatus Heimdallarchaeaceae archaeon]